MRFNPKADISGGRVSDVRGGGGGGGMGNIPIGGITGGGIGTTIVVIIIILFVVLSQCMGGGGQTGSDGGTSTQGQAQPGGIDSGDDRYANCKTGADAQNDPDCARKAVALSLEQYWAKTLPEQGGTEFVPASINTFAGAVQTGCGQATSQVGPFYCPPDQKIYLDTTFFRDVLEGQLGGQGGDFVEPYVLGHEYGHHIQNLLGTMGQVRTQKGPESDAVRLELQADCYAGMWTRAASGGDGILLELDQGDIDEALDSAKTVGDDRIQQKSGQGIDPEGWTHGSSEQRMRWFMTGYQDGTVESCDTFAADQL